MIEEQQEVPVYSRADVERLKTDWFNDPCWDIEDTEGFENYYIELKAYRLGVEASYDRQWKQEIENKAKQLNCSLELAIYILKLEQKFCDLVEFLEQLEENSS
jgi:hypothetical protein